VGDRKRLTTRKTRRYSHGKKRITASRVSQIKESKERTQGANLKAVYPV